MNGAAINGEEIDALAAESHGTDEAYEPWQLDVRNRDSGADASGGHGLTLEESQHQVIAGVGVDPSILGEQVHQLDHGFVSLGRSQAREDALFRNEVDELQGQTLSW